ncbi:MAG: MFS transporter [Xanthobacteraceae bacterium]|nr:MFS transporter [Xanthobacteraceae bacterium]MCW5682733.1 MFS transporter [Xanthobacteraceae bacterium]
MNSSTSPAGTPRGIRLALFALLLGNFFTGIAVLSPTGMMSELSSSLGVTIPEAGLLITFGAVVLTIGSPLMAWLASRFDRRLLLAGTMFISAALHAAMALAPEYFSLLALRLVMLAVVALFTPQAAGVVALIEPDPARRAGAISLVFLGWSLAVAIGLPLITLFTHQIGWRVTLGLFAALMFLCAILLLRALPAKLFAAPVSLSTWVSVARNPFMMLVLLITVLQTSGQFHIFPYIQPLATKLAGATPGEVGVLFGIFGVTGFIGNVIAARIVGGLGPMKTSVIFLSLIFLGILIWALGAHYFAMLALGATLWGMGFAAANSMQQARLVGAAPALAGATVALNTSSLYIGQAVGSGISGLLYARGAFDAIGFSAAIFVAVSIAVAILFTRGVR